MSLYSKRVRFYCAFLIFYVVFQLVFLCWLRSYNQDTHSNAIKILEIYKDLSLRLNGNSEYDNTGIYKIVTLKNSRSSNSFDITLVSQCSSNHFPTLYNLFTSWHGPVSLAIFSEVENIERTLWNAAKFLHCFTYRDFGLYLVAPSQEKYVKNFKFAYDMMDESDKSISCDSHFVSGLTEGVDYNWTRPYPVNLLRNIAKSGVSTDYLLVIDVDITPSPDLQSDFLRFVKGQKSNSDKVVYVVPIFEILPDIPMPLDKKELLMRLELKEARPFYFVPCRNCQKLTNYFRWLTQAPSTGVKVLHEVEWKHPWEPFFIAKRDVPGFDERFKQYGMNRVSQICELHIAGYKFAVLDNAFLVHRGYKTAEGFHVSKSTEMEANRRLYARFKTEVKYRYPYSERSC